MTAQSTTPKYAETLRALHERYEVLAEYRPLAIGSGERLIELHREEFGLTSLRKALYAHVRRRQYRKNSLAGADRFDPITGEPAGTVTEKQAAFAVRALARQEKRSKEAKQQPQETPQEPPQAPKPVGKGGRPVISLRRPRRSQVVAGGEA